MFEFLKKNYDLSNAYTFKSDKEAQDFCMKIYYPYAKRLDDIDLTFMMNIQSHSLSYNDPTDRKCIDAIKRAMEQFPGLPYDIILYRAGFMKFPDRLYLSSTFMENIALETFANNDSSLVHKIVARKGAKIIPSYALNHVHDSDPENNSGFETITGTGDTEMEVIIDASKLKKHGKYYIYE